MVIIKTKTHPGGLKITISNDKKIIGSLYLYFLYNDLHREPFAFIENVNIGLEFRGQSFGSKLINEAIKLAKEKNCYKIICTSRNSRELVHRFYIKCGFKDYGKEFRLDL